MPRVLEPQTKGLTLAHPTWHTEYMITTRKIVRAARAALPTWMLAIFAACMVIPGPFDELAFLTVAVILCAVQPMRVRRAVSAWRGGKSHRAREVCA